MYKIKLFLCRFSELNLNGLKLSKPVIDSLCQLARTACLSGLMLEGSSIGTVSFCVTLCLVIIVALQVDCNSRHLSPAYD